MSKSSDPRIKLHQMMVALAESVVSISDEELLTEAQDNPKSQTSHVRCVLNNAILKAKKVQP